MSPIGAQLSPIGAQFTPIGAQVTPIGGDMGSKRAHTDPIRYLNVVSMPRAVGVGVVPAGRAVLHVGGVDGDAPGALLGGFVDVLIALEARAPRLRQHCRIKGGGDPQKVSLNGGQKGGKGTPKGEQEWGRRDPKR